MKLYRKNYLKFAALSFWIAVISIAIVFGTCLFALLFVVLALAGVV